MGKEYGSIIALAYRQYSSQGYAGVGPCEPEDEIELIAHEGGGLLGTHHLTCHLHLPK
jgi:hypothetical protein